MISIDDLGSDVHAKHPADNTNANKEQLTSRDNTGNRRTRVIASNLRLPRFDTAQELKANISFRRLMESDGYRFQQSGRNVKCHCPFHSDRTPSFTNYDYP